MRIDMGGRMEGGAPGVSFKCVPGGLIAGQVKGGVGVGVGVGCRVTPLRSLRWGGGVKKHLDAMSSIQVHISKKKFRSGVINTRVLASIPSSLL
jgi:hypothetical protein